jgi:hypothetical protein
MQVLASSGRGPGLMMCGNAFSQIVPLPPGGGGCPKGRERGIWPLERFGKPYHHPLCAFGASLAVLATATLLRPAPFGLVPSLRDTLPCWAHSRKHALVVSTADRMRSETPPSPPQGRGEKTA